MKPADAFRRAIRHAESALPPGCSFAGSPSPQTSSSWGSFGRSRHLAARVGLRLFRAELTISGIGLKVFGITTALAKSPASVNRADIRGAVLAGVVPCTPNHGFKVVEAARILSLSELLRKVRKVSRIGDIRTTTTRWLFFGKAHKCALDSLGS